MLWSSLKLLPVTAVSGAGARHQCISPHCFPTSDTLELPPFSPALLFTLSRVAHEWVYNFVLLQVFKTPELVSIIKLHLSALLHILRFLGPKWDK